MSDSRKVNCRFIHEKKGLLFIRTVYHVPRVGDELRISENLYFEVTAVVWVYDEEVYPFARANIGIIEAQS